jgi:hypothetical protein
MRFVAGLIVFICLVIFLGPGFFVVLFFLWILSFLASYAAGDK